MEAQRESKRRQRLDRYELLAEIASGGMATVYLGRLPGAGGFQRFVAIKRLHPHLERETGFIEMFLDEARIAARLHHPNVVSTLEIGQSPRGYYLVMDYVEGDTLAKLMVAASALGQRIPIAILLRIIHDSLLGLHAAHELKDDNGTPMDLVHRDVSPQNILIGIDGTSRITDFGVARAATRLTVTREGQLKGKLGYMAPEQARGGELDRRTDVFAAAVILWEALAGRRLFRGRNETDAETLHRILYEDIAPPSTYNSEISQGLDAVVAMALEREPAHRFQDCASFADAVEAAAQGDLRMASTREVARYVESLVGKELETRRDAIKQLAPPDDIWESSSVSSASFPRSPDLATSPNVPKLMLSSMTPNSMTFGDTQSSIPAGPNSNSVTMNGLPTPPPPAVSGTSPLFVGILVGVSLAALAIAVFLFSAKSGNQPAAVSSVVYVNVPAAPVSSATTAATATATVSASAAASPSASSAPVPTHKTVTKTNSKPKNDDLVSNPYQ